MTDADKLRASVAAAIQTAREQLDELYKLEQSAELRWFIAETDLRLIDARDALALTVGPPC